MNKVDINASLAEVLKATTDLKVEINGRRVTLKDILASKNITVAEKDSLLVLIKKVESEFTLNKNEVDTGKNQIATSITNKGVSATGSESHSSLASKIDSIKVGAVFS